MDEISLVVRLRSQIAVVMVGLVWKGDKIASELQAFQLSVRMKMQIMGRKVQSSYHFAALAVDKQRSKKTERSLTWPC